jgi:hypothetical protein
LPILSLWRLQWPKLRARFSFCGGVRAVRTIEGMPMTIQAAIERDVRRLDRGVTPPAIVSFKQASEEPFADWINVAAAAYVAPDKHRLLNFFARIGDSLPGNVALFRPTVTAYLILASAIDADGKAQELVAFTAAQFPISTIEPEFKRAFFGPNGLSGLSELTIIGALAATEFYHVFDASDLQLRQRSASLWASGPDALGFMCRLLIGVRTPLSEEILSGLLDTIPEKAIIAILDGESGTLEALIRRCPQIATTAPYWVSPAERQSRAARALGSGGIGVQELMPEIIVASLNNGADPVAPDLIEVFGDIAVPAVLEWVNSSAERSSRVPLGLRSAMQSKSIQMLEWISTADTATVDTARFLLSSIDFAKVADHRNLTKVMAHYLPLIDSAGHASAVHIACEALKVALNSTSQQAAELATISLDIVYGAAMSSMLLDEDWKGLSNCLPQASWWQDWDRCDRLRKGVVERYRSQKWPAASLVNVTTSDELFEMLVSELRDNWYGRRVVQVAIEQSGVSGKRKDILLDE